MNISSKLMAVIVFVLIFGGILFSNAMGWWQTESTKEAAVFTEGEFEGQANPADIRGSYTFGDVEKNFAVPASLLAEAFGIEDADPADFQVKSLEEMYADQEDEIGTSSVRLFVAFYKGLPYDLSTDIYLPDTAAVILQAVDLSSEQVAYLRSHTLIMTTDQPTADEEPIATEAAPVVTPQGDGTEYSSSDRLVKGKTTFAELLDWGLTEETIERIVGLPLPDALGMSVKDFCSANGLSFETIKAALQAEVDH